MIAQTIDFIDMKSIFFLIFISRIFLIQSLICIIYCVFKNRFNPVDKNKVDRNFAIAQFWLMLLAHIILYISELLYIHSWIHRFNNQLHHIAAIFLIIQTLIEKNIISVVYCLPYLFHSFYWSNIISFNDFLLAIYNLCLLLSSCYIGITSLKYVSFRIPLYANILLQINLFYFFYGKDLYIYDINYDKFKQAILLSTLSTSPFNIYLFMKCRKGTNNSISLV
jgi:hypothetical protein